MLQLTPERIEYCLREICGEDSVKVDTQGRAGKIIDSLPAPLKETAKELSRTFITGATRSADAGRYDPEGYLSPIALERFCEYMAKHQVQADGAIRASDNWQRGIPQSAYVKGMWRHFLHLWTRFRGGVVQDKMASENMEEDLCAIIFNAQGMLHELIKSKRTRPITRECCAMNQKRQEPEC